MSDSVWNNFLSSGDEAGASSELPKHVKMLLAAREEAKKAKEDAKSKEEQIELMTAMLQAAEEELKLRTNQLDITNAMLHNCEAELVRKDEQLDITTQMLRKAEAEISQGTQERRALRKELAGLRDVLPRKAPPVSIAPVTAKTPSHYDNTGTMETLVIDDEPTSGAARPRSTAEEAEAASQLAGDLEKQLAQSFGRMAEYDEISRLHAAKPVDLPEQRQARERGAPRVLVAHADSETAMRPKKPVADNRDTASYIRSRQENQRLPVTHTSMRIESGFDHEDEEDGDEAYRHVNFEWR